MGLTHQQVRPLLSVNPLLYINKYFLIAMFECLPQFIDLCILLGCDYCGTIKGIGPKRAIDLIKQHGSIEEILDNIDPNVSLFFTV